MEKELYKRLLKIADNQEVSKGDIARHLGLTRAAVTKWNQQPPTFRRLEQIAKLLNVELEIVIKEN